MATLEDAWKRVERWADIDRSSSDLCLLDLRRRVEALEARAATEESSATEPAQQRPIKPRIGVLNASIKASMDRIQAFMADLPEPEPAPAADRPLWAQMATTYDETPEVPEDWAAVLDVVADWMATHNHIGAAESAALLRAEARRAREGRDD